MKEKEPTHMVHWASTPRRVCKRKDSKVDDGPFARMESGGGYQYVAIASHTENVTCPVCRQYLRKKFPRAHLFVSFVPVFKGTA